MSQFNMTGLMGNNGSEYIVQLSRQNSTHLTTRDTVAAHKHSVINSIVSQDSVSRCCNISIIFNIYYKEIYSSYTHTL